jgi:ribosome recycling factor
MDDSYVDAVISDTKEKMSRAVNHTRDDFATVRTGRASPGLVEKLMVEYYGSQVPLQQIAGIQVPEARMMIITPYDKTSLKSIEKAIQASDLGINPGNDGTIIRLSFPPLTEERRKEFVKQVHGKAEDGRVAVRNVRRAARKDLEALEKDSDITSDELERAEKDLDKITHDFVAEIDRMLQHKEQELLAV